MLTCKKCKEETEIVKAELTDGVIVSECCYAPVLQNGEEYTYGEMAAELYENHQEAIRDAEWEMQEDPRWEREGEART